MANNPFGQYPPPYSYGYAPPYPYPFSPHPQPSSSFSQPASYPPPSQPPPGQWFFVPQPPSLSTETPKPTPPSTPSKLSQATKVLGGLALLALLIVNLIVATNPFGAAVSMFGTGAASAGAAFVGTAFASSAATGLVTLITMEWWRRRQADKAVTPPQSS